MNRAIPLLVLLAAVFFRSGAQEIKWQKTIGGSLNDLLYSVEQCSDGGYILAGSSQSNISGDKTENSKGGNDFWVVKADSLGDIQWQNTIGGSSDDELFSIRQTSEGGYILGGRSKSSISGDKTENSNGEYDYWIVKADTLGNIQWQNTIGGNEGDHLYSVRQTTDGGYILGGWSSSDISGDKMENSIGNFDYWIVKTDSSGNIQWQNTIGGSGADYLYSLQQTSDGGYILGGNSESNNSGDKTENSLGGMDYWIVKTDSAGNIQWQNTIGGSGWDMLYSIQQTNNGGYIMGGSSYSNISGDKTENCKGSYDYWIVKVDSTGSILWQSTIGGSSADYLYCLEQTSDSSYILGGMSTSNISGDKTERSNGINDYWIVKTDESGKIQWQNTIGGNSQDHLTSLRQTSSGEYILGGYSNSNFSGDKTENSKGNNDFWIAKLTNSYSLVTGKLFIDVNSNNLHNSGEPAVINKKVAESSTGRFGFSGQNGQYGVAVLDSGNYAVTPAIINFYNAAPTTHVAYFSGVQQTDSLNDFAFQPASTFSDLCVHLSPLNPFRSGRNAGYGINYENVGTTTLNNVSVIFFPDTNVSFVTSNPAATNVTPDSMVWNIGTMLPFQTGIILVTVNVNPGLPIGTLINSWVKIEPIAGDANPACNIHYWEVQTIGAYDPNDILVSRETLFTSGFPNPPYLDYIIRFQNTGNDTAFNVKVLNPIDTFFLKLNTLEFVASSHPVDMKFIYHERNMEFRFDNILLPDSNINEPASHGYVRYRIQPQDTLTLGDSIKNFAAIYFDFNDPVITNTAMTEIVMPTGMSSLSFGEGPGVRSFPNPATDQITFLTGQPRGSRAEIVIYNSLGQPVLRTTTTQSHTRVDICALPKGLYMVEVRSQESVLRGNFVKQ